MHYDVMCIYIRNLIKRLKKHFPAAVPIAERILCCLPAFHAYGHCELCQVVYAIRYATGFGLQYGEGVEHPWRKLNLAGPPTSEMMAGHRQDKLTASMNFWNLEKRGREGTSQAWYLRQCPDIFPATYIAEQVEINTPLQYEATDDLAARIASAGPQLVLQWVRKGVQLSAPTPLNWKEKERGFQTSNFILHHDSSTYRL